jgi:hypothetical protein
VSLLHGRQRYVKLEAVVSFAVLTCGFGEHASCNLVSNIFECTNRVRDEDLGTLLVGLVVGTCNSNVKEERMSETEKNVGSHSRSVGMSAE